MFYFRVKSSTATRRRTRADSSDSDPETTPLCTKEMNEIEKVHFRWLKIYHYRDINMFLGSASRDLAVSL